MGDLFNTLSLPSHSHSISPVTYNPLSLPYLSVSFLSSIPLLTGYLGLSLSLSCFAFLSVPWKK